MPWQCSKPDWHLRSSPIFLPQSFSFIILGKDSEHQCWNNLPVLLKALYLILDFVLRRDFRGSCLSSAHGVCSATQLPLRQRELDASEPQVHTFPWKTLHSEHYCCIWVDRVRRQHSELMSRRAGGSQCKTSFGLPERRAMLHCQRHTTTTLGMTYREVKSGTSVIWPLF